jgi:asparagine synthase (glutamine-hydrolysing)
LIAWDRASGAPGVRGLWSSGFIANRQEIIGQLSARESLSDLELAAALCARFGIEAPRLIHGSFAWIVWDGDGQRLVAVRDRLGVRELYYAQRNAEFLLAGRIEPLLAGTDPLVIDPRAVLAQLRGQPPAPDATFYGGISAVAPGGLLIVTGDRIETRRYWRPEPQPLLRLPNDAAYGQAFRELFLPIIGEYLSGGDVGVTLSGGLDSTTVAAAVREASPRTGLTAFTWTAPELPEADESEAVAAVCQQLGCGAATLAADQCWPLRTEPGIRPERISPLFNLYADAWDATFRAVRERGIRVLFSGLSGDHLFGGDVFSYPDLLVTGRWRKLVSEIREQSRHSELSAAAILRWMTLAPVANTYLPGWERERTQPVPWLGEALRRETLPPPPALPRRLLPGRRERLRLLRDPLLPAVASLLTRQAARHGIDFRHPLLDHRMFEFAAALPTAQSFSAGKRKLILRSAMRGRLPDSVLDRRGKTYSDAIARRGLRERERDKVWALMTDMRAAQMGYVDERRLRTAYDDYLAGRSQSTLFWHSLTLEAWLRRYFS